jgi:hypothetical protein
MSPALLKSGMNFPGLAFALIGRWTHLPRALTTSMPAIDKSARPLTNLKVGDSSIRFK